MKQENIFISFFSSSAAGQSNSTELLNPIPDVHGCLADANHQPYMKAVAVIIFVFFLFRLFCIFLRFHRRPIPYYLAALALLRHRRRIDHMMNRDYFNDGRHETMQEGVEAAVMETFPVLRYADVRKLVEKKVVRETGACAICLCEFEAGRSLLLRLLPKCDHVFHVGCIDRWLAFNVTCPVCRAELTADSGDGDKFER